MELRKRTEEIKMEKLTQGGLITILEMIELRGYVTGID